MNIGGIFTSARFTMDITSHLVGMVVGIGAAHLMEKKQGLRRPQQKEGIQKREDLPKAPLANKG
jgi:rhomboid-like protein